MPPLALVTARLVLRPWRDGDQEELVQVANDPLVSRWLADRFPHPYTREHADGWVGYQATLGEPPRNLAIALRAEDPEGGELENGELIGGLGLDPLSDVYRIGSDIGYWLARGAWGKGYATEAMRAFVPWVFAHFDFSRLQAHVYAPNTASARVLEKVGFRCEGRLERAVMKRGEVLDVLLYALLREASPTLAGAAGG